MINLNILKYDQQKVTAYASWDSSMHDSAYLNRATQNNERIYLVLKVIFHVSAHIVLSFSVSNLLLVWYHLNLYVSSCKELYSCEGLRFLVLLRYTARDLSCLNRIKWSLIHIWLHCMNIKCYNIIELRSNPVYILLCFRSSQLFWSIYPYSFLKFENQLNCLFLIIACYI